MLVDALDHALRGLAGRADGLHRRPLGDGRVGCGECVCGPVAAGRLALVLADPLAEVLDLGGEPGELRLGLGHRPLDVQPQRGRASDERRVDRRRLVERGPAGADGLVASVVRLDLCGLVHEPVGLGDLDVEARGLRLDRLAARRREAERVGDPIVLAGGVVERRERLRGLREGGVERGDAGFCRRDVGCKRVAVGLPRG